MNKYDKLSARHAGDKYIILGTFIVLVILGLMMAWLTIKTPKVSDDAALASTTADTLPVKNVEVVTDQGTTTAAGSQITFGTDQPVKTTSTAVKDSFTTALAKWLARQQITMYGASWCSHCAAQKAAFGEDWARVPYVECTEQTNLCLAKGIEAYPTWMKADGSKLEGEHSLEELATWAGFSQP